MNSIYSSYRRHRFPAEITSRCAWLHFRFFVNLRDIVEMMAKRGITVSYETVRVRRLKFGRVYAKRIRSRNSRPGDRWQ